MLAHVSVPAERICDVVFVHGLDGDAETSWTMSAEDHGTWPTLFARDLPDYGVYSLGYPASPSHWLGHSMPLEDRGRGILQELVLEGLGVHPIVFVCHSLGGLVVKQVLRTAASIPNHEWNSIASSTRGIAFLATPHTGARLADYVKHLSILFRWTKSIDDLRSNEASLRDLNIWFRENCKHLNIEVCVYHETKPTRGVLVVDQASSDPGITGVVPIPSDEDHISISKPASRDSLIYKGVLRLIHNVAGSSQFTARGDTQHTAAPRDTPANANALRSLPDALTILYDWEDSIIIDAAHEYLDHLGVRCDFQPIALAVSVLQQADNVAALWTPAFATSASLMFCPNNQAGGELPLTLYLHFPDGPPAPTGGAAHPIRFYLHDVIDRRLNTVTTTRAEALESVVELLDKALDLNERTPFDLLTDKFCSGRDARNAIEDAYFSAVYHLPSDDSQRKIAVVWYAAACRFTGDWTRALQVLSTESALTGAAMDKHASLHLAFELLSLEFELGRVSRAYERAKEILEQALTITDWYCIVACHRLMGMILEEKGAFDLARDHFRRGLTYAEELADTESLSSLVPSVTARKTLVAECLRELGGLEIQAGDIASAEALFGKARHVIAGDGAQVCRYLNLLIEHQEARLAYARSGEYDQVMARLWRCYESLQAFLNPIRLTVALETIIGMDFDFFRDTPEQVNRVALAVEKLRRVRELRQHHYTIARARQLEGALLLARCQWEESLTILRGVRNEMNRLGKAPEAARAARMIAQCHLSLGNPHEAKQVLQQALHSIDRTQQPELWSTLTAEIARASRDTHVPYRWNANEEMTTIGEFLAHRLIREDLAGVARGTTEVGVTVGLGDDGAVLEIGHGESLVVSTDSVPPHLMTCRTIDKAQYVARFAVVSALADILAMGGRPIGLLVNVHTGRRTSVGWIRALLLEVAKEADKYGTVVLGGDLKERSYDSVTTVALGTVSHGVELTRSGAKPGDYLAITDSSCGKKVFGARWAQELVPFLSLEERSLIVEILRRDARATDLSLPCSLVSTVASARVATAAIDTSDGLLACAELIGKASDVGVEFSVPALENLLDPGVVSLARALGVEPFVFAFSAGHEWEIIFSLAPACVSSDGRSVTLADGQDSSESLKIIGRVAERCAPDEASVQIRLPDDTVRRIPRFTDEKFAVGPAEMRPKEWLEFARHVTRLVGAA